LGYGQSNIKRIKIISNCFLSIILPHQILNLTLRNMVAVEMMVLLFALVDVNIEMMVLLFALVDVDVDVEILE
jgi:hypothetical protein